MNKKNKRQPDPPAIAVWILRRFLLFEERYEKLGDFEESFKAIYLERGIITAVSWYWFQLLKAMPSCAGNILCKDCIMFKNYSKTAFRSLKKSKGFSFINISGLAVGMAASMLILLYVQDEFNYDGHHENAGLVYRVLTESSENNLAVKRALTPGPLGNALVDGYSEITAFSRISVPFGRTPLVAYENKLFYESKVLYADPGLLQLFSLSFLQGNEQTALNTPDAVVITREVAQKYFGELDPLGEILRLDDTNLQVTGVIDQLPKNSFLQFDFLIPHEAIERIFPGLSTNWNIYGLETFVLLDEGTISRNFEPKVESFLLEQSGSERKLRLQPLTDMHFETDILADSYGAIDKKYMYILIAIALALLVTACVNFMNLSTARSAKRAGEVGLRKVVGASRRQLVCQFLGESILLSVVSFFIALVIVNAALPEFNTLTDKELTLPFEPMLFLKSLVLITVVGIFAGSYPALFLSSFKPVTTIKGGASKSFKNSVIRKYLVVIQFSVSTVLIFSTLVIYNQLSYITEKDLGFAKEQVAVVPLRRSMTAENIQTFRQELTAFLGVVNVSLSEDLPGASRVTNTYSSESGNESVAAHMYFIDDAFIELYDIRLKQGRAFSNDIASDAAGVLINEKTAQQLGWKTAVGRKLGSDNFSFTVLGVVENFHIAPLHNEIAPVIIHLQQGRGSNVSIKLAGDNIAASLDQIQAVWERLVPGRPFDYFFLDTKFDTLYSFEQKMQQIFLFFSLLTISISCLGLFGLASFMGEQRAKEIGVRKVLGAPIPGLVALLSGDFGKLVLAANIFAWPLGFYAMSNWLESFAYRIDLHWELFAVASLVSFGIALITISYQTLKTALTDPVTSLRSE